MPSLRLSALLGSMTVRFGVQGLQVIEAEIQHFHGAQFGSFIPMMELGLEDGSQKVLGQIDTGSSDLVLAKKNSKICKVQKEDCKNIPEGAGSFQPSKGSDTKLLKEPFNATFVSGESFTGKFAKTGIQVGDQITPGVQFGLYDNGNQPGDLPLFPILGTGDPGVEATDNKYPNMPAQMVLSNMIKTNAYGVYLNDFRGSNGSVVFGGVDEAKFDGELQELPWIPFPGDPPERGIVDPVVEFSSLTFIPGSGGGDAISGKQKGNKETSGKQKGNKETSGTKEGKNKGKPRNQKRGPGQKDKDKNKNKNKNENNQGNSVKQKGGSGSGNKKTNGGGRGQASQTTVDLSGGKQLPPALIDTGASAILVPRDTMERLASAVGANLEKDLNADGLTINCGLADSGAMLQFGFVKDKAKIQVPLAMMVQPVDLTRVDDCTLAIFVAEGPDAKLATLGSSMIQATYTVFDNDQKRLLMAQAKPNVTESSIKELSPAPANGQGKPVKQKDGASGNKGPGKQRNDSSGGRERLQRRGDRSRQTLQALRRKRETRRR